MVDVTEEMLDAGEDALGGAGQHPDSRELVRAAYVAMAPGAAAGKHEPAEPYEPPPDNVVMANFGKKDEPTNP